MLALACTVTSPHGSHRVTNRFQIGGTNFGVNGAESSVSIDTVDGVRVVNVEIRGDEQDYNAITEDEDSEWSWTRYPPHLYIRGVSLVDDAGVLRASISGDDLDDYKAAIYLMEHNDVDGVELRVDDSGMLQVHGTVLLLCNPRTFSVTYAASGHL